MADTKATEKSTRNVSFFPKKIPLKDSEKHVQTVAKPKLAPEIPKTVSYSSPTMSKRALPIKKESDYIPPTTLRPRRMSEKSSANTTPLRKVPSKIDPLRIVPKSTVKSATTHDSKAKVKIPIIKKDKSLSSTLLSSLSSNTNNAAPPTRSQIAVHNDINPSAIFLQKHTPVLKGQTTHERNTSAKLNPQEPFVQLKRQIDPATAKIAKAIPDKLHSAKTIGSKINIRTPREDAFEQAQPWNDAQPKHTGKTDLIGQTSLDNKYKVIEKLKESDKSQRHGHSVAVSRANSQQTMAAHVSVPIKTQESSSKLDNAINQDHTLNTTQELHNVLDYDNSINVPNTHLSNEHQTPYELDQSSRIDDRIKVLKKPVILLKKKVAPKPVHFSKSASVMIDSSMPSRITSETSMNSLDMTDPNLALLELMDITQTERYSRLKEAYQTQRLIRSKIELENKQLRDHISVLNKRMVRDYKASKSSIPLEATQNLKYQFQKRVAMEKVKYDNLEEENKRLVSRIKDQEESSIQSTRKVNDKVPGEKVNEVLVWKAKYKEVGKEKERCEQALIQMTKECEMESRTVENLEQQLEFMKMHFAHLAPKAVQLFENEYRALMDDPFKASTKKDGTLTRQGSIELESKSAVANKSLKAKSNVKPVDHGSLSRQASIEINSKSTVAPSSKAKNNVKFVDQSGDSLESSALLKESHDEASSVLLKETSDVPIEKKVKRREMESKEMDPIPTQASNQQ